MMMIRTAWAGGLSLIVLVLLLPSLAAAAEIDGALAEGDERAEDGTYYDAHEFEVEADGLLEVRMISRDFDTYLTILGPGGDEEMPYTNDDSEELDSTNSYIRLPATVGTYRILAGSYQEATGTYRLLIETRSLQPMHAWDGELASTDEVLPDTGEYADGYRVDLEAGQRIMARVTSDDFDAYVYVGLVGTAEIPAQNIAENDDDEQSLNAMGVGVVPYTGRWTLTVTSAAPGETGAYRAELFLIDGPMPGGEIHTGELTTDSEVNADGIPVRRYTVALAEGEALRIELFGTYDTVVAIRLGDEILDTNDDAYDGYIHYSAILFRAREPGTYTIEVTGFDGDMGRYCLALLRD